MPYVEGVERVRSFVASRGIEANLRELDSSTHSSALAARALGCTVGEIAKSVVFCGTRVAVVVLSGDRRVDLNKLNALVGGGLRMATPDEVKGTTGYEIGGVPPFPHDEGILVLPDVSLTRFQSVWAAAGEPNAVMRISTAALIVTLARPVQDLSQERASAT